MWTIRNEISVTTVREEHLVNTLKRSINSHYVDCQSILVPPSPPSSWPSIISLRTFNNKAPICSRLRNARILFSFPLDRIGRSSIGGKPGTADWSRFFFFFSFFKDQREKARPTNARVCVTQLRSSIALLVEFRSGVVCPNALTIRNAEHRGIDSSFVTLEPIAGTETEGEKRRRDYKRIFS